MPSTTTATARLEARISPELHALLKRAAALQDRTLTDFVIAAVQDAAGGAFDRRAPRERRPVRACPVGVVDVEVMDLLVGDRAEDLRVLHQVVVQRRRARTLRADHEEIGKDPLIRRDVSDRLGRRPERSPGTRRDGAPHAFGSRLTRAHRANRLAGR